MSQMETSYRPGGVEAALETLPSIEHPRKSEGVFNFEPTPTYHAHGEIDVARDNVTWTLEIPETLAYDGIALFVSGYGAIKRTSRPMREAMAKRGVATATYSPARKHSIGTVNCLKNAQDLHVETIARVLDDIKSRAYLHKILPNIDMDKQLMITHSMGGLSAPRYVEQDPSKSDGIVNIAAAGYGSPTLLEILEDVPRGLPKAIYHEIIPAISRGYIDMKKSDLFRMARHIAANPIQTVGEAISCLLDDIRPTVENIRSTGVKVGYIALQHDILVRPNPEVSQHVDAYTLLGDCGHIAPQKKPELIAHEVLAMHRSFGAPQTQEAKIIDLPVRKY